MRKLITAATIIAALAVPTIAAAAPVATGVSSNNNTKDAVGFCVSAGNYVYHNGLDSSGQTSTGQNRSELNASNGPGAVSALIHAAQDPTNPVGNFCANGQTAYAPPGQ